MANRLKLLKTTFNVGDIIKVHQKIKEGDKERIQIFRGIVIAIKGKGTGKSFTVRRVASFGVGVERIWPVNCPSLVKIELARKSKVRRAKLYYLRHKVGKQAIRVKAKPLTKIKEKDEAAKPRSAGRKTGPKLSSAKKV